MQNEKIKLKVEDSKVKVSKKGGKARDEKRWDKEISFIEDTEGEG